MASADDAVADAAVVEGRLVRRAVWVIVAIGIGIGLAGGSGSIIDGTGTTAGAGEAIPAALVGALVGVIGGGLAAWACRGRLPLGVRVRDVALVAVIMAGCLGALVGAGSVGEGPAENVLVEATEPGGGDADVAGRAAGDPVVVPQRSQNNLDDISGAEVTIVLIVGLGLLLWALWFFSRQVDRVPVDSGVLFLEGRDIFDGEEDADVKSVADALDRSLGALRASNTPRDSILAAYATLLDELERVGLGRHAWEGPMEHVGRCLAEAQLPDGPIGALVDLFGQARFGIRPMTTADRDAAQHALVASVDTLRGRAATAAGRGR